jgi:UDPglucose 6-dehydrogenase
MTFNINIIGVGFLGGSIANTLIKNKENFNAYDITDYDKIKCHGKFNYFRSLSNLVENSEVNDKINIYFICVPTPSGVNGECDTSIVESVVEDLSKLINKKSIIIVKSTVSPGTTRRLNGLYSNEILDVVFCPEFLVEKRANEDMYNADFALFGTNSNEELNSTLKKLFENIIYKHKKLNFFEKVCGKTEFKTIFGSFEKMELFKYTVNNFLAVKVWYFNKIYDICDELKVDYQEFKTLFPLEPRISGYGTRVPGDHGRGYAGACIRKDQYGMIKVLENLNIDNSVFRSMAAENEEMRMKK